VNRVPNGPIDSPDGDGRTRLWRRRAREPRRYGLKHQVFTGVRRPHLQIARQVSPLGSIPAILAGSWRDRAVSTRNPRSRYPTTIPALPVEPDRRIQLHPRPHPGPCDVSGRTSTDTPTIRPNPRSTLQPRGVSPTDTTPGWANSECYARTGTGPRWGQN
jgi:hypothetical protein